MGVKHDSFYGENMSDIKSAGIYYPEKFVSSIHFMRKTEYECMYLSTLDIPEDEIGILVHMILASQKGFGHDRGNKNDYGWTQDTLCRYYISVLFLFPEMDRPLNEDSLFSCMVHNEYICKKLENVRKDIYAGQKSVVSFYKDLEGKFQELFMSMRECYPLSEITVFNSYNTKKNVSEIRANLKCDFCSVASITEKFPYIHTLDLVFGQTADVDDILNSREVSECEEYENKYLKQKSAIDDNISTLNFPENMLHPLLYNISSVVFFIVCTLPLKMLFERITGIDSIIGTWAWIIVASISKLMYLPTVKFDKDRIAVRDKKLLFDFVHGYELGYAGIWSYCNFVEYGTFRKFGMKYIYFSKKHMTDEEFKNFSKKMIPYDYDSVAVPYKKDYMKIAQNLVFAERKDR